MAASSDAMIGETVNIARGEEVSVLDLARKICTLLGRGNLQPVFEESRPGDVMRHFADVRKAERLFRFRAETSLDAGLELFLSWFTGQGYDLERLASEDIIFNWKKRG
jgi:UDP-glucose 4-epimerase